MTHTDQPIVPLGRNRQAGNLVGGQSGRDRWIVGARQQTAEVAVVRSRADDEPTGPNDTRLDAFALPPAGGTFLLCPESDVDWYSFNVKPAVPGRYATGRIGFDPATYPDGPPTFDLVMTDYGMPGLTGADVARAVRRKKPSTPIVLLTGWSAEQAGDSTTHLGDLVSAVLNKPVTMSVLNETIAALLKG